MNYDYTRRPNGQANRARGRFTNQRRRGPKTNTIPVEKFINQHVTSAKTEVYQPTHRFTDFRFDQRINNNLKARGYVTPTWCPQRPALSGIRACPITLLTYEPCALCL